MVSHSNNINRFGTSQRQQENENILLKTKDFKEKENQKSRKYKLILAVSYNQFSDKETQIKIFEDFWNQHCKDNMGTKRISKKVFQTDKYMFPVNNKSITFMSFL